MRLSPLTHYGAFKVCNELNARVYWLDHGITSIGLRPWTVYGVGRDFGMTSEPTKAIKSVALGQPYRISYGGMQDLQYVEDVAATFVRALTRPFEGADAFNLHGAVAPIEAFVGELCDVVAEARALSPTETGNCRLHPTLTTRASTAGSDRSPVLHFARGSPRHTGASAPCTIKGDWTLRNCSGSRMIPYGFGAGVPAAFVFSFSDGTTGASDVSGGKRSLGIGLTSILAVFRSAVTTLF